MPPPRRILQTAKPPAWHANVTSERRALSIVSPPPPKAAWVKKPTPGLPLAPIQATGSAAMMGHHLYHWHGSTTSALHFRPESRTVMVDGRPVQAVIMSHNHAPHWEWQPLLRYSLRPLNPVVLVGVSAHTTEAKRLEGKHAPCQWWKARQGLVGFKLVGFKLLSFF
jgi:hypothetical protein